MLELLDKGEVSTAHPVPVLFVHGGFHAAWCWDDHFLDYFAGQGFRATAVSLRAHGGSTTEQQLSDCRIVDYVADVRSAVERVGQPPILVGHSMGGFVVQRFLGTTDAPAAVLLGSVPIRGALRTSIRLMRRHPVLVVKNYAGGGSAVDLVREPRMCREQLFSPGTPDDIVQACAARVQDESMRAAGYDMVFGKKPKPAQVRTPVLVLGAEQDGFVHPNDVRATARGYRTRAEFFPGMGHNMMVEPGWQAVADRIISWLGDRLL